MLSKVSPKVLGFAAAVSTFFGMAAAAGATATYDISPVTTSITSELSANIPVILGICGALIALGIAWKFLRKGAKV